jgi:hypothetical protein
MSLPTEKFPARFRIRRETCGCLTPRILAISTCVIPLSFRIVWICRVSCAFSNSCSGFGSPRSAKTFPLPSITRPAVLRVLPTLLVISVLPLSVVSFGFGQPPPNQLNLFLRRSKSSRGRLLKDMQDINGIPKAHRVNSAPGIPRKRRNDFNNASSTETPEGLRRRIGLSLLSVKMAELASDSSREGTQITERSERLTGQSMYTIILIMA